MVSPLLKSDAYKFSHMMLYPKGTQTVYETLTPRVNSFFPWSNKMTSFGYHLFFSRLDQDFKENFFDLPWADVDAEVRPAVAESLGADNADQIMVQFKALHDLNYLPLKVSALPEGTLVPMQVPVMTIENTHPDFYWLPGYLETLLLSETFVTSTVASMARIFRSIGQKYADLSADDDGYLDFQFHDFSQRGQHGNDAAILSGIAHLTSFKGTDIMQAPAELRKHYRDGYDVFIGGSVLATEHSVMESYGTDQLAAYRQLIEATPNGILSIVSDTYDYWEVVNKVLPELKDEILARDGKVVIRPDSDTMPVELTDDSVVLTKNGWVNMSAANDTKDLIILPTGRVLTKDGLADFEPAADDSMDTVSELLLATMYSMADTFGTTTNSKGYKVLDPHIGILHGEGVTLDTVADYFDAITNAHFSAENVVFGVGAYVYSVLVSRDSFGQALKATSVTINGVEKPVFKNPKTASEGFKKSRKGRVQVIYDENGDYMVRDGFTAETLPAFSLLRVIYNDGFRQAINPSFTDLRQTIKDTL